MSEKVDIREGKSPEAKISLGQLYFRELANGY